VLTRFQGEGGRKRLIQALMSQPIVRGDVAAAEAIADDCELLELAADTVFIEQDAWESDVFLIPAGSVVAPHTTVVRRHGLRRVRRRGATWGVDRAA